MAKRFDEGGDFLSTQAVSRLRGDSARQCPVVAVDASVGFQVQVSIEELSLHALDR